MSINPINELKRRLTDEETPLPKRLCLAKNAVMSHHFAPAAKERLIAEWLQELTDKNVLSGEEFRLVIGWVGAVDELTNELKLKLVQIVSKYLKRNPIQKDDLKTIISFIEDSKIYPQLIVQINEYLHVTITTLQYLRHEENNLLMSTRIINNFIKYYKDCKKKYEFILKFLEEDNIETIFSYLDTEIRGHVLTLCEVILFPINKRSYYITLLKTYIRKDNIDELITEKGDNMQSVLKIIDAIFKFTNGQTNSKFIANFIDAFVSCYQKESQLVFAFYIMVSHILGMEQNYLNPTTNLTPIDLGENADKIRRNLFLDMIEILLKNDVDIGVRLTDTLGEKISKVETKKTFLLFIQAITMAQLKLEGKLDVATIKIITTSLKLDPTLIEQKIKDILPFIMTSKKNNNNVKEAYVIMLNCLLETLFKLSRGVTFIKQILPMLKLILDDGNTEQSLLKENLKELENEEDIKIKNKIIKGVDIFPEECIELYGKLTSELMFRQNKELLLSLQEDFENYSLLLLEEDVVSPSTVVLTEVLSAILSTFLLHNKMADHTVPLNIAEEFWNSYQNFEDKCLKKFGKYVSKDNCDPSLKLSFLKLCHRFSQLKLLNIHYGNTKMNIDVGNTSDVYDFSTLLPCLKAEQWITLCSSIQDEEAIIILGKLILTKIKAIEISNETELKNDTVALAKTHLIKRFSEYPQTVDTEYTSKILFSNLNKNQLKQTAKHFVKLCLNNDVDFKNNVILTNRELLNAIVIETARNIIKSFDNNEKMLKALNKNDFDVSVFAKEVDIKEYFDGLTVEDDSKITTYVQILKELQIYHLEEKYQLLAIFVLLALKKCCHKKIRRNIDYVLQSIFELSSQSPDLYKIFNVDLIFSFDDKMLLDLLTLKIKTSNSLLIIKSILESAVKRVKMESELVKNIVELLLKKHTENSSNVASIEYFSDPAFQISCIILPLIAKQKKAITASAYRSILADLQEKLHIAMLESFKNINFAENSSFCKNSGNTDESMVESDGDVAALNAMAAYSLTLSKYCETTDTEEIKKLDCLWSGLEFFIQNAIRAIQDPKTKIQHVDSCIQLLNVILRYIKKLDSHYIFETRDKLYLQIWQCIKSRLFMVIEKQDGGYSLEDIAVVLKFLCENASVECFVNNFVVDLNSLLILEKPQTKQKEEEPYNILASHKVSKYLWANCLKANIVGPKCVAMTKTIYQSCRNARSFIWQHYEHEQFGVVIRNKKKRVFVDLQEDNENKIIKINDNTCELLKMYLDTLTEAILAAKKISLDYKFLDAIFQLQNSVHVILGSNTGRISCEISWQAFFKVFEGSMAVLNGLIMSREELLEDRWPCYMQSYRALVRSLCERSLKVTDDRNIEQKLSEIAHSVEKLTQSISKRKAHVSRIAAYTIADVCSFIERTAPPRIIRQHLENSVALLIQASDTNYSVAFLRRALVGAPGQMTMTNLYTMYKRYHKYVGNA